MIQQPPLCSPQLYTQRGMCKVKSFGKLCEAYFLRYVVVAKSMGRDEDSPLLFCQTVQR